MAHATIEWTDNLEGELHLQPLMELIASEMRNFGDVFPVGGIRVRAIRLSDYVIADGACDRDAFINIDFKIGAGRDPAMIRDFFDGMFEKIKQHLAPLFETRPLALSAYVGEAHGWKHNTIHNRLKAGR